MIDLEALTDFLLKAKTGTYAADGAEVEPERPGFRELRYAQGDWDYRDSYAGYYCAPGQEVVRFQGKPIWTMSYDGGMSTEFHGNRAFAKETFTFLKEALKRVERSHPFRGPKNFKEGDWEYLNDVRGTVEEFRGTEHILYRGKPVFRQHYFGGMVIHKDDFPSPA